MKFRFLMLVLILTLALSACSPQAAPTASPQGDAQTAVPQAGYPVGETPVGAAGYPSAQAAGFELVTGEGTQVVNVDFLSSLGQSSVTVNGAALQGPDAIETLSGYRVANFTEVVITGASGSLTLTKDQLAGYVFAISADGVTLAKPDAAAEQIVRGVQRVEVK